MAENVPLYGSIVSAPTARYTDSGDLVVHFRMVQDDRYNANRSGSGPAEWKDREPPLFMDVDAWRQEWLVEADVKPGDRIGVRGVIRQDKDYPHPQFDQIKAATGIEVMQKGGVKIEAREVLVSTAQRIVTTRNPHKDGTAASRRQGGQPPAQQQAPQGQQPPAGGDQWGGQQAPAQQQAPQQQDPWTNMGQGGQQAPQQGGQQQDPWANMG